MSTIAESAISNRRLIDAHQAAKLLGCSWRTVYRHADRGLIPFGCKLGALRRWDAADLEAFIANGCKPVRKAARP